MMSKKTRSGKEYWVQTDAQAFADWYYSHLNKIVHTHLDEDHGVWFSGKPVVGAEPRRPISMLMGEEIQAFIAQQKHEFEMLGEIADTTASPPALAEWIIGSLLRGKKQQAALGDLDELFHTDLERFGERRARRLYWARSVRFLWPMLRRIFGRIASWGVVAAVARRFFPGG
jgi:hypothetical protein